MSNTDEDNITENEDDDAPYVEYDILVSPSDPTLENIAQKLHNGDMIIPFYQRNYVWDIKKASKLIESFLIGLPVPQIFLYMNDDEKLEVIDGQQRVRSIQYFFNGFFNDNPNATLKKVFQLTGLSEKSKYYKKTFEGLEPRDQRKLKNATLRAINIKQTTPDNNTDSVFHIFERLNTGSVPLKAQDIRNAVYRGNIVDELRTLNDDENWRTILNLKKPDKNQKDIELILRLFSLFESWQDYKEPMLTFLNSNMKKNREFDSDKALKFKNLFIKTVDFINQALEKPFRPNRVINGAVLDSVIVTLMENELPTVDKFKTQYDILMNDSVFKKITSQSTTNTSAVHDRMVLAKKILINA